MSEEEWRGRVRSEKEEWEGVRRRSEKEVEWILQGGGVKRSGGWRSDEEDLGEADCCCYTSYDEWGTGERRRGEKWGSVTGSEEWGGGLRSEEWVWVSMSEQKEWAASLLIEGPIGVHMCARGQGGRRRAGTFLHRPHSYVTFDEKEQAGQPYNGKTQYLRFWPKWVGTILLWHLVCLIYVHSPEGDRGF